jgi:hypothetical protein
VTRPNCPIYETAAATSTQDDETALGVGHAGAHQLIALPRDRAVGADADVAVAARQQDDRPVRMRRLEQSRRNAADLDRARRNTCGNRLARAKEGADKHDEHSRKSHADLHLGPSLTPLAPRKITGKTRRGYRGAAGKAHFSPRRNFVLAESIPIR